MMEEKMFYTAPEVEVICFAPMETVATSTWNFPGTGEVGSGGGNDIDIPNYPSDPDEGEED